MNYIRLGLIAGAAGLLAWFAITVRGWHRDAGKLPQAIEDARLAARALDSCNGSRTTRRGITMSWKNCALIAASLLLCACATSRQPAPPPSRPLLPPAPELMRPLPAPGSYLERLREIARRASMPVPTSNSSPATRTAP
jgi:hypothetical protein